MWVFGYGSLMWDGWEKSWECHCSILADLAAFRRTFNKASIRNWGTKEWPGPTLNLEADKSTRCTGMAFEFSNSKKDKLLTYLKDREGSYPVLYEIHLVGDGEVMAFVPIYAGKNVILGKTLDERADMARKAKGVSGLCIDYVRGITEKLCGLGIDDPAVTDFWNAVKRNR